MSSNELKILITGATGTVGSELMSQLEEAGVSVYAGVRDLAKAEGFGWKHATLVEFDYNDKGSMRKAMVGVDKLFLLPAGMDPVEKAEKGRRVVDIAKGAGVKDIVKMSSYSAGDDKNSPHHAIEQHIKALGIAYTFLRPTWFMQNFHNYYMELLRETHELGIYTGDAACSLIDVRDIAAIAMKALTEEGHKNKIYELTSSDAISTREACKRITEVTGFEVNYTAKSDDDTREYLKRCGWGEASIERMVVLFQHIQNGRYTKTESDAEGILGRKPIGFDAYLAENQELFR